MKAQIINKKVMLGASVIRCGDKNVDTIVFECPLKYNNLSLEDLHVYVKTENRLGEKTKSVLYSVKRDNKLFIDWAITEEVTAINGILACQLSFESDDGEKVLNTNVFEVVIENSIKDGLPRVNLEYNHIIQLQNELQRALKEEVLRKGNNVSLLNNDANYLTGEKASEIYLTSEKASETYLTNQSAEQTYLPSQTAEQTYLTKEKASSDYLSKSQATTDYLTKTQATSDYLSKTQASSDYLTKNQASETYLTSEKAGSTYLTTEKASETYLTNQNAEQTYLPSQTAEQTYLTKEKASSDYLSKSQATTDYLTKTQATTDYLTKTQATSDYLSKTQASSDYLTKNQASSDYATKSQVSQTYATKEEVNNLSFGLFFEDYQTFLQSANSVQSQPKLNCIIRIKTGEICDLCVSAVKSNFVTCTLTEEQFAKALLDNGSVQVGYCEYLPAKALAYSDSLPEVDISDAGKYLSVNENGEWHADILEAYMGEAEGGGVVETIKGVGIENIYSGESQKQGDYTVTPVTFVKTDQTQDTINVFTKNGCDITSAQSGSASTSGNYTITPVTFNKNDGSTFTAQIKAQNGANGSNGTNGANGKDGVSITSGSVGETTEEENYSVTPVVLNKSDGTTIAFNIKAKNGRSISSITVTDGEVVMNYDDGQSENIGSIYGKASSLKFGLIKADVAYSYDTVPVRISSDGKLFVKPATAYTHTITVTSGTSKCIFYVVSALNTKVYNQSTMVSVVGIGYHPASGIVNGVPVMSVKRTNNGFFMMDINGGENAIEYSSATISDTVRTIEMEG
ncbi:MAG: hypothetical protein IKJ19_01020 [Clostridia bacterium]|nr:hypothetical protein [Clostridia bacterium]